MVEGEPSIPLDGEQLIDSTAWQAVRTARRPKNPANRTVPEIVEKVLHLRKTYCLGPIRIVCYLARYHAIIISDAGVYRILRRNGLNQMPGGTRVRKIHPSDIRNRCRVTRSRSTSNSRNSRAKTESP